jgi:hypothetical protein
VQQCELCAVAVPPSGDDRRQCENCGAVYCCPRHAIIDEADHYKQCWEAKDLKEKDVQFVWEKLQPRLDPAEELRHVQALVERKRDLSVRTALFLCLPC